MSNSSHRLSCRGILAVRPSTTYVVFGSKSFMMALLSLALDRQYDVQWILVFSALVAYLVYKVRVYYRLSAFKGPPGSGWFELWHSTTWLGNNAHFKFKEVCDKYGMSGKRKTLIDPVEADSVSRRHRSSWTKRPHHLFPRPAHPR
jgi:hypothetical protein